MARFQGYDFAGQQVFTDEVLVRLAARRLKKVNDRDRHLVPPEHAAGRQTALAGDEPPLGRDDHRVKQPDLADAVGERPQITQVLAVAEADLYPVNLHRGCRASILHPGRSGTSDAPSLAPSNRLIRR